MKMLVNIMPLSYIIEISLTNVFTTYTVTDNFTTDNALAKLKITVCHIHMYIHSIRISMAYIIVQLSISSQ